MNLVILAGGMGSRFGGLKQLTPVDEDGNFILDYSIYDAIKAGFDKVVFIIKEENYEAFRETVGKRIEKKVKTEYAFQKNDNIPDSYVVPETRVKPFGTAHALLAAEDKIDDNFLVINADDFYGQQAYKAAAELLSKKMKGNEYFMLGYNLRETLSDKGKVKRGLCQEKDGFLSKITESEVGYDEQNNIVARPLERKDLAWATLSGDETTSTNIFGFSKDFFSYLNEGFAQFLEKNKDDLSSVEYLLPALVDQLIDQQRISVKMIKTDAKWQGITYKDDLEMFENFIKTQKQMKVYPNKLWG
ncbi:MAG: NTP transferase domain-containing protein [Clostridia bacterium]|jgi:NDP-sugar pyrophosphorylase family protein|nr:NTP transferase domain-containing protein [Clostridia bacterium]